MLLNIIILCIRYCIVIMQVIDGDSQSCDKIVCNKKAVHHNLITTYVHAYMLHT